MKEREYKCTPLLHEKLVNIIKKWLIDGDFQYQEFVIGTNEKLIQTKKKEFIINIAFKEPLDNRAYVIIEEGKIWYNPRLMRVDAKIMHPLLRSYSAIERKKLDEVTIKIFKEIDSLKMD